MSNDPVYIEGLISLAIKYDTAGGSKSGMARRCVATHRTALLNESRFDGFKAGYLHSQVALRAGASFRASVVAEGAIIYSKFF
ncbi:hypothetical protein OH492_14615 [Vibrio chagasii]|nr:hypothetical protein [Vibrio chagasii]